MVDRSAGSGKRVHPSTVLRFTASAVDGDGLRSQLGAEMAFWVAALEDRVLPREACMLFVHPDRLCREIGRRDYLKKRDEEN